MIAASGLASGRSAASELAALAVERAMDKAGLKQAGQVLLLLNHEMAPLASEAVRAASSAASCIAVSGMCSGGLFTEEGWILDQPAAAAMVFSAEPASATATHTPSTAIGFVGATKLPETWQAGHPRVGLLDEGACTWQHSRLPRDKHPAEMFIPGVEMTIAQSPGLRILNTAQAVEAANTNYLLRIGGTSARDNLVRSLPPEWRLAPPLHLIQAIRNGENAPIAILGADQHDGSLLLADKIRDGDKIAWAIRQPLASEMEMRECLQNAKLACPNPSFALMFSSLARSPLFYGGQDRDLMVFRETYPHTPLLGAYGSGQITPISQQNRVLRQTVLTLLFKEKDAI